METTILQKMSLYDILSQLIPGWFFVRSTIWLLDYSYISMVQEIMFIVIGYFVGLLIQWLSEKIWNRLGLRNDNKAIRDSLRQYEQNLGATNMREINKLLVNKSLDSISKEDLLDKYYEAYMYVRYVKQYESIIQSLEGQITFIRSMILVIILLGIVWIGQFCFITRIITNTILLTWFFTILLIIGIGVTAYQRQQTIYRVVWEGYEYFKRLEHEDYEM